MYSNAPSNLVNEIFFFLCVCHVRLQGLLQSVYGERCRLRKHMVDLDASERDTLLKVCRKVSFGVEWE